MQLLKVTKLNKELTLKLLNEINTCRQRKQSNLIIFRYVWKFRRIRLREFCRNAATNATWTSI